MTATDRQPAVFQRLLPNPASVTAAQAVQALAPAGDAPDDRPQVALNMVCTADELPLDSVPLLRDPESTVVVLTASDAEIDGAAARRRYLRAAGEVLDLRAMLGRLRARFGVHSILCEGGPTLNGALLAEGLVDELFLSLAPKLTGGLKPLTILEGMSLPGPVDMQLTWMLECDGHLFYATP